MFAYYQPIRDSKFVLPIFILLLFVDRRLRIQSTKTTKHTSRGFKGTLSKHYTVKIDGEKRALLERALNNLCILDSSNDINM